MLLSHFIYMKLPLYRRHESKNIYFFPFRRELFFVSYSDTLKAMDFQYLKPLLEILLIRRKIKSGFKGKALFQMGIHGKTLYLEYWNVKYLMLKENSSKFCCKIIKRFSKQVIITDLNLYYNPY